jgi:chromosome segregation ATPase
MEPYDDEDPLDSDIDDLDEDDFLANNPAMQRVQAALKRQLERQATELNDEIREKNAQLADAKRKREDTGVSLYGAQQQLAKLQTNVEDLRDKYEALSVEGEAVRNKLDATKDTLGLAEVKLDESEKGARAVTEEHSRLQKAIQQLEELEVGMSSEIKLAQRAADKAAKGEQSAEVTKQEQDLYIDRLQERSKSLQDQRKVLQTQLEAQSESTKEALARMNQAQEEVDAVRIERKEIASQWNSAVQGLTKRNETLGMMQAAADRQQQEVISKDVELESLKKLIGKEHGVHESLTGQLARIDNEISAVQRVAADLSKRNDKCKVEYSHATRSLQEEEEKLRRTEQAASLAQSEVTQRRTRFERLHAEQTGLEQDVVAANYDHKTIDRFGKATVKGIKEKQHQVMEVDLQLAQLDNQTARASLVAEGIEAGLQVNKDRLKEVETELSDRNAEMTQFEHMTRGNQLQAERNETQMSITHRKIAEILDIRTRDGAGKSDVTPQEIERDKMQEAIQDTVKGNAAKQQLWLQRQSELVRINKVGNQQEEETESVNSKYAVLSQKKYRIAREIETNEKELVALQRNFASLQRDVVKLDTLISENRGVQESLANSNVLMETEFLRKLKDEELASIKTQTLVEETLDEKKNLLNEVVDCERQVLLWEKKIQLAEEIKAAIVDPDGEGESAAMKKEIHRMELRLVQLNRQRELLIQEMERAVERRGDINMRAKVASRSNDDSTRTAVQKQLRDLQAKVKQGTRDANAADADVKALGEEAEATSVAVQEREMVLQDMDDTLQDLSRAYESKRSGRDTSSSDIIYYQQLYKHISSIREKGKTMRKTPEQYRVDVDVKTKELQSLNNITEYLAENNPSLRSALAPIQQVISTRLSGNGAGMMDKL